jgi:hypothetical protein
MVFYLRDNNTIPGMNIYFNCILTSEKSNNFVKNMLYWYSLLAISLVLAFLALCIEVKR